MADRELEDTRVPAEFNSVDVQVEAAQPKRPGADLVVLES
jgi:hypothetical protein